jgi:hypothetical protein
VKKERGGCGEGSERKKRRMRGMGGEGRRKREVVPHDKPSPYKN